MTHQVRLKYGFLRVAHLWKFVSVELAQDWCNAHMPPHPNISTWEVVEIGTGQVVAAGPWTWEVKLGRTGNGSG